MRQPDPPPHTGNADSRQVVEWVYRQLQRAAADSGLAPHIILSELHVAPASPSNGMVVLADGTDWDPGSGAGVYRYNGSAWVSLG